jgi:hypothetical protein
MIDDGSETTDVIVDRLATTQSRMQCLEGGWSEKQNRHEQDKFLPLFYADVINPVRKFINKPGEEIHKQTR